MPSITIPPGVRQQLRRALLMEDDLIRSLEGGQRQDVPGEPGRFRCTCRVAVPRLLDPEIAEWREVVVEIREVEGGWEIVRVDGLREER